MNSFLLPVACVASAGIAFLAGRHLAPVPDVDSGASSSAAAAANAGSPSGSLIERDAESRQAARERARSGSAELEIQVRELMRNPDSLERNRQLFALLENVATNEEYLELVSSFRELGITQDRMGEYRLMLTSWAKVDPLGALDYASENTGGNFARQTILATWAGADADSALAWALENAPAGDRANPWVVGVIEGVAATDLDRASQLTATLPRSRERGDALDTLVQQLAGREPVDMLAWTTNFQDDENLRHAALSQVAALTAREDIDTTIAYLDSIAGDDNARLRAVDEVTAVWAETDASAAMAYVDTLPVTEQGQAIEGIMRQLSSQDPTRAADYLRSNSEVPDMEEARRNFVYGAYRENPALAAEFVPQLGDGNNRNRAYRRVYREWAEQDPAAARQWLESQDMNDNFRNRLLQ